MKADEASGRQPETGDELLAHARQRGDPLPGDRCPGTGRSVTSSGTAPMNRSSDKISSAAVRGGASRVDHHHRIPGRGHEVLLVRPLLDVGGDAEALRTLEHLRGGETGGGHVRPRAQERDPGGPDRSASAISTDGCAQASSVAATCLGRRPSSARKPLSSPVSSASSAAQQQQRGQHRHIGDGTGGEPEGGHVQVQDVVALLRQRTVHGVGQRNDRNARTAGSGSRLRWCGPPYRRTTRRRTQLPGGR